MAVCHIRAVKNQINAEAKFITLNVLLEIRCTRHPISRIVPDLFVQSQNGRLVIT